MLDQLTFNFGSLDIEACLVLQLHLLVVAARVQVGRRVLAYLSSPSLAVAEGERASEGTLDEVAALSEHCVEGCIPCNGVAQGLHRLDILFTIT